MSGFEVLGVIGVVAALVSAFADARVLYDKWKERRRNKRLLRRRPHQDMDDVLTRCSELVAGYYNFVRWRVGSDDVGWRRGDEECLGTLVAQLLRFQQEVLIVLTESVAAIESGQGGVVLVVNRTQLVSITVAVGFEYVIALDAQFQRLSGEYVLHRSVLDVRTALVHDGPLKALPGRPAGGYDWIGTSSVTVGGTSGRTGRTTRRSHGVGRAAGVTSAAKGARLTVEYPIQQASLCPQVEYPTQQEPDYPTQPEDSRRTSSPWDNPGPSRKAKATAAPRESPAESSRAAQTRRGLTKQPSTTARTSMPSSPQYVPSKSPQPTSGTFRTSATSTSQGPSLPSRALTSTLTAARSTASTAGRTTSAAGAALSHAGHAASSALRTTASGTRSALGRVRLPRIRLPRRRRRVRPGNPYCAFALRLQDNPALHANARWYWRDGAVNTRLLLDPGSLPRVCPECEAVLYDEVLRHSEYHVIKGAKRTDLTPRWRAKYHVPGGGVWCKWCVRKGKGREMEGVRDLWRHMVKCKSRGFWGERGAEMWECPVKRGKFASHVDVDYEDYVFRGYYPGMSGRRVIGRE